MTNATPKVRMTPKVFLNQLLTGAAQGTILSLIPNAVIGTLFKNFSHLVVIHQLLEVAQLFQVAMPFIIASLIAKQFDLAPMKTMIVGAAAFAGSGVIQFDSEIGRFVAEGTGDIMNIILTAAIAILLFMGVGSRFGSVEIIAFPLVVGSLAGLIGKLLYPYVTQMTLTIGQVIHQFTTLQPIVVSILIACSFALLILSPLTTVGVAMAIQLNGLSAGAAAMGIASTTIVLVIHSWRTNQSGVTLAIALGGMKLMMPNLFKYPIIVLPCLFTATIAAIPTAFFNISGTASSAGFGLVGLVGPLTSLELGLNVVLFVLCWFIVPIVSGLFAQMLFEKIFKLYDSQVVFKYQG
ncbi:PTS sugar transporter subunit IIC [Enterococcus sp. LJL98]